MYENYLAKYVEILKYENFKVSFDIGYDFISKHS